MKSTQCRENEWDETEGSSNDQIQKYVFSTAKHSENEMKYAGFEIY